MWQIWIDTGGTFTDCIAVDPEGHFSKGKVLSSSALRGQVTEKISENSFKVSQDWNAPENFIKGFEFVLLGQNHPSVFVDQFDADSSVLKLGRSIRMPMPSEKPTFEVRTNEEAPILASRLVTKTPAGYDLPPLTMRLATTKGTNALLEQEGAPTLLLVTKGFGDILQIGDQKRPDLFALHIQKPKMLYGQVLEIPERIDANGNVISSLDTSIVGESVEKVLERNERTSFAICLMNSYTNAVHEEELAAWLEEKGAKYISVSSRLNSFIKLLPRAQTTTVNAYLQPVLQTYLQEVKKSLFDDSLRVMTSAGGLISSKKFNPKDSLLSGPAGGVVGASTIGKQAGFDNIISFDMGGTSTDVARYDGGFDYVFEHTVGSARLKAPALSIETVAAGGGSVCAFDGQKLTVGPESAGAFPGPACYGVGGPLTLTDVNLLLHRLEPDNFSIPVSKKASQKRLDNLLKKLYGTTGQTMGEAEALEGFLRIANERMADAIRKISLRKGYDPADYALVAFGGAGSQHACALAQELGMQHILIPEDAGLLSAYGLGHAVVEQFAEEQLLQPLSEILDTIPSITEKLESEARKKLRDEEGITDDIKIRRKLMYLRLSGQESSLEIEFTDPSRIKDIFKKAYEKRYGHWTDRLIEAEAIRIVASTKRREPRPKKSAVFQQKPEPIRREKVQFNRKSPETPVFNRASLKPGHTISGPALILDPYSTIVVEPGWNAEVLGDATLNLVRAGKENASVKDEHSETVALELFTNRFTSIAEEMGEILQRTALSVNVKERLDFSCALLNADGELVVNAPHIPVHLGALGLCVRRLKQSVSMQRGDVLVTNHPAYGGSHLPDITVTTPIFTGAAENTLLGYAASRAHHAEIGGTRPGSMPPDATSLAQEGLVIPPMHIIEKGREQWKRIRNHFETAPYPSRNIEENMADLQAAVAANHRGKTALQRLADTAGAGQVQFYMSEIKRQAARKMRQTLREMSDGTFQAEEFLDDGTPLKVSIIKEEETIVFDFDGTGAVHPRNLNATPAIVQSVVMYVLRLLVNEPLPLNEGLLEPVTIHLPPCLLNPPFTDDPAECPALVGGNTETSQRLTDLLLKPFERIACSQGTMNNVLFGNDQFGYYETVGGGTGAGPSFNGSDAVHHHMTNTAGTDPEILEHRYPVRLDRYCIRKGSGGKGNYLGGDGIIREITFLQPVSLSVLTQHRKERPYGLRGGEPGAAGRQWVIRANGKKEELHSVDGREMKAGDRFILYTPGGGGYGKG